ncbi:MAG: hypothetical protein JWP00_1407 [Chloroflexi bacterium]|nr:hypothetical protein [Chloroflexota bacterium]
MISREKVLESTRIFNDDGEEIFMAGQWARAGHYRQVDSTKIIHHKADGPLPASCDGHRAEYCRFERPWINLSNQPQFKPGN